MFHLDQYLKVANNKNLQKFIRDYTNGLRLFYNLHKINFLNLYFISEYFNLKKYSDHFYHKKNFILIYT